ncbi:AraC family transcriptional regulator [Chitinophaga sp. SYP-B3965]|uniref:AraC family transcriptional regulator n=1 Tax=Chitinophaga sp. SYP-B3965 TaxID=2663120 RepID=UPI0012997BAA|nr:AraC family transcriptional regulator [Chitinophaga sp. SYP-B3965]
MFSQSVQLVCNIHGSSTRLRAGREHVPKNFSITNNTVVHVYGISGSGDYLHEHISVAEVAYRTGFSSPAYFSTVFKYKLGVSPATFKGKR